MMTQARVTTGAFGPGWSVLNLNLNLNFSLQSLASS